MTLQMLVTTNDSRIRLFALDDYSLICKYKGAPNSSMQIAAVFSESGKMNELRKVLIKLNCFDSFYMCLVANAYYVRCFVLALLLLFTTVLFYFVA